MTKISADLDRLIKRAAEVKTAGVKAAEGVAAMADKADDKTAPATTGAQAASNKVEAAKSSDASVDAKAKTNPEGASVEKSTDGATAVASNGQEGPKSVEFKVKGQADNGTPSSTEKFAAAHAFAAELRKQAEAQLTDLDKFLVKAARATSDPKVKTAAEQMPDDELAAQASDGLMQQIASGQLSDADAEQILQEALAEGAITPEELQQAAALVQQAGAEGAPVDPAAVDPAAVDPAAVDPAAVDPAAVALPAEETVEDPELEQKLASAKITPDHPEYLKKLETEYPDAIKVGEDLCNKIAAALLKESEKKEDKKEDKKEEKKEEHEKAESPKEEKKEEAGAKLLDQMAGVNLAPTDAAEKQALAAVKEELGINDAQLSELQSAPMPSHDKVAAAKAAYRAAILSKVAALQN